MTSVPLVVEPDLDDPGCATVFVEATVDGAPRRFVLDTGGASSQILDDGELGRLPVLSSGARSGGLFGDAAAEMVLVSDLGFAGTVYRDQAMARVAAEPGRHAFLGLDILGRHSCRVDLRRGVLELGPAGAFPAELPLRRGPNGHAGVTVEWGGITASACVDTGAGITVVDPRFLARNPGLFAVVGATTGTDAGGRQLETPTYQVTAYRIAGIPFVDHVVAVAPLPQQDGFPMELLLGYPTIAQATWTLDFVADRYRIDA